MFRSGRTSLRLTLQFAFLYSVLSAIIFAGAYWFTNYEVRELLGHQIEADGAALSKIYETEGIEGLTVAVSIMAEVNFEYDRIYRLTGPGGALLAGNVQRVDAMAGQRYVSAEMVGTAGALVDEITGYWIDRTVFGPYTLLQGIGNHVIAEVLEALGITLAAGFLLIMGFGSLMGVWVGRLTESRIATISATMEKVAAGELSVRVSTNVTSTDDLSRVSSSINETLEQLENLMESQIQITNDIAHDLRTPLQRLRQRLEKMSNHSVVDPRDASAALEQTEDIISTFNALLRIAQIEASDRRERFKQTDLGSLATNVHEAFEPSAEEGGQTLGLKVPPTPVVVLGDPDLLMQLISNFVENALRHTSAGTAIEIGVSQEKDRTVLWVSDNGPGIDASDRDKVFRRFFRGEKSRTTGGNGLGLSLCKAIAELHHATLDLTDNDPGLKIEARFAVRAK